MNRGETEGNINCEDTNGGGDDMARLTVTQVQSFVMPGLKLSPCWSPYNTISQPIKSKINKTDKQLCSMKCDLNADNKILHVKV